MMLDQAKTSWNEVIRSGFTMPAIGATATMQEAASIATNAVDHHLSTSPAVRDALACVPKGDGTDCPDSPLDEIVKYVANQKGFIDKRDPALTLRFIGQFVFPVFEFEREVVGAALTGVVAADELALFVDSTQLATAIDRLWERWFATICVPYQPLDDAGQSRYMDHARTVLARFDYTVFDYSEEHGIQNSRTWAEAFPEEIAAVLKPIKALQRTSLPALGDYFTALGEAYACTNIDQLEKLWATVDEAWIRIPNTALFVPVHGMETTYEHPFGVSPEFRLELRTSAGRATIDTMRTATIEHAKKFGVSDLLVESAKRKLGHIDISVFLSVLRAGVAANFRYSGQAVPNREDVLSQGGKIFLDSSAPLRSTKRYVEFVDKHCEPQTARMLAARITPEAQLMSTASHEYAHPVGRTSQSDTALGADGMGLCEEAKATLLGILACEHGDPSPAHRFEIVANAVGRVLRFMHQTELDDATAAAYVRENLAAATTLLESRVIALRETGVVVDVAIAQSTSWFDALRTFNHAVLDAYTTSDKKALDHLVTRYCNKSHPQVAELIRWVNR